MRMAGVMLWVVCAAYWIALFTLTHLPRVPVVVASTLSDKAAHFLAYAVLGGTMYLAMWASGSSLRRPAALVMAVALLYGAADELTQPLVGRTCELYDWVADAAGAIVAVGVFASVRHIASRRQNRTDTVMKVAAGEGA